MSLRLCGRCEELSDELAGAHTMRERDRSFNASPETKKERRRDFNEILLAEYRVAQEDPNDSRQRRVSRLEERQARAVQRDRERQSERAQRQLQRLRKAESRELRRIARSTLVSRPMFESTFDASPFSSSLCRDGGLPDDVFFIPTVAMSRRYSVLSAISSGSVPRPTISVREESPSPPVVAIQMAPSAADPSIDIEDCFSAASVKSDAKTSAHQSTSPRVEALSTECVTVQIAEPIPQEHVPAAIPIEPAALPLPIPSRDRAASSLSRRRGSPSRDRAASSLSRRRGSPSRDRAASSLSPRRGGLRKSILSCPKRESTHFTRPLRQNRTRREPKPAPQAKRPDAAEVRELKQSLNDHPVVRYINQSDIVTRNRVLTVQERQDEVRRHCELAREWFPKVAEGIPCTVLGSGQSKHAHLFITADLEKCLIAGPNKDIVVPVDCMRYVWDWKEAFSNPSVLEQLRMLGLQDYPDEEKRRIFVLHFVDHNDYQRGLWCKGPSAGDTGALVTCINVLVSYVKSVQNSLH